jgi:hypothetical protein
MLLAMPVLFGQIEGNVPDVSTLIAVAIAMATVSIFSVMRTLPNASRRWAQFLLMWIMFAVMISALFIAILQIGMWHAPYLRIQERALQLAIGQLVLSVVVQVVCALAEAE